MKQRIYSLSLAILLLSAVGFNSYAFCKCILDCAHCSINQTVEENCCSKKGKDVKQYLHNDCCEQSNSDTMTFDLIDIKEDRDEDIDNPKQLTEAVFHYNPFISTEAAIRGPPSLIEVSQKNLPLFKLHCSFLC